MKKALILLGASLMLMVIAPTSHALTIWADEVTHILRGDTAIGDFAGYYGGAYPGLFPVSLTEDQAKAAVLGAPDGDFLSLPGKNDTPYGTGFRYAYVEVSFGSTFNENSTLLINELGNNGESAHVWVWFESGGNVQFQFTRGIDDLFTKDLSIYSGLVSTYGVFDRIAIGGIDLLGDSQGFDIDAIGIASIAPVPEPATILLFGAGFIVLVSLGRKKIK